MYDFKTLSGIDTLFFFYDTTKEYELLFQDIMDQIATQTDHFNKSKISYNSEDIKIKIGSATFEYLGKSKGFYWLRDLNSFFRFGCKDSNTNQGLLDIQMQYQANGIYNVGIKGLLRYTDNLFKKYTTGDKQITRVDLNIFLQYDMSSITKENFVTRKRLFITHYKEVETKHKRQTLYIGRKPFLLRMYDKVQELKQSKKIDLMKEYFTNNGININEPLDNLEFEYHRAYLKTFGIECVDDLLKNAELLFKDSMDAIRMVDLTNFVDNTSDKKNRNRAPTHKLWEYIKDQYKLDEFLQTDLPLERIERKAYLYTYEDAITDHIVLARKCTTHKIPIGLEFYKEVLDNIAYPKKVFNDFSVMHHTLTDSLYKPDVTQLSTFDLKAYYRQLEHDMNNPTKDMQEVMKLMAKTLNELELRGFPKSFPF